jgi:hypothetical protein
MNPPDNQPTLVPTRQASETSRKVTTTVLNSDDVTPTSGQSNPAHSEVDYTFGRPLDSYLSPMEVARVTILRSKLRDAYGDLTPTSDRLV